MKQLRLTTKISMITVVSLTIFVVILGFYFDKFLKHNYYNDAKKKILYAQDRVYENFKDTEEELISGIGFVQTDTMLIASVELINNYQDKQNYNAILLDEEKKDIAKILLDKVKISFNSDISLYDKNEELIVYIQKDTRGYKQNFISYENSKRVVYSKYEDEKIYKKEEFKDREVISFEHVDYYTQPELKQSTQITYHYKDEQIYFVSHSSIYNEDDTTIAHIEMSKVFDSAYFKEISDDLNLNIFISEDKNYEKNSLKLFNNYLFKDLKIVEEKNDYYSSFSIKVQDNQIYLLILLDKSSLNATLDENRKQLVLFLITSIILLLTLFNSLMYFGISNPIKKIMQQIKKIENSDYSSSEVVHSSDELQDISLSINSLADAISTRENSLKQTHKQLEYLSTHDELSGLLNRRSFALKLEYALKKARRNSTRIAVLFLDLDEFKQVNDTLGHSIGDNLLKSVASRLESSLRDSDILARVGGDEFNIFIDGFTHISEVQVLAQKVLDEFEEPFVSIDNEIVTTTSIGISIYPDDGEDAETLIKNADVAMYMSKDRGKNSYSFYATKFSDYIEKRMAIVTALKSAIKNQDEFLLHYQPKISIKTQKIVGIEALIRWNSPKLGFVRPDEFIGIAEETRLIIDIGKWVLNKACEDFVLLKESGCKLAQLSVNVSGVQLQYSDMLESVKDAIDGSGISANELELEVTESYIATNEESAIETLSLFREMGIELAIDDFGTGYSSMSYLQKLPITRLKIDKAFVDDLPDSSHSSAVVKAIIALAQAFNLKITVEGVEKEEQLNYFKDKYCDDIQGYFYSKPLCLDDLKEFIALR